MHGTIVNIATVAAGTTIGRVGGARLPERVRRTVTNSLGLFTLVLGTHSGLRAFEADNLPVVVLIGTALGGMAGTALGIEDRLERLGERLKARLGSGGARGAERAPASGPPDLQETGFAQGFLVASIVFCVGPLTILGSLKDGLEGDPSLLVIKSVADGFASLALASMYGIGVGASILTIAVYQGGLTLAAGAVRDLFTPEVLRGLDAAGGLLMIGIGLRLLEVRDVKVGDLLPALVLVPAGAAVFT